MMRSEKRRLPDLSHVSVIVPSLYSVVPFTRALVAAANRSSLALPVFFTWPTFAERQVSGTATIPDSRRAALLYQALKSKAWFDEGDLWDLVGELLELFDELTLNAVSLGTQPDFAARLAHAYRAKASEPLQFESRLVHELWFAMHESGNDPASAYATRLGAAAHAPAGPLYVLAPRALTAVERSFLAQYARRAEIHVFIPDRTLDNAPLPRLLNAAWVKPDEAMPSLRERALALRRQDASPTTGRIRLLPALSLEHEAQCAATAILQCLERGETNILVVVLDRLVARRVRALLERSSILVADETGWAFSTTSASTLIARWLDCIANDFHYETVLDLLQSPFVQIPGSSHDAVFLFESAIRTRRVMRNLDAYRSAVDPAALPLLDQLAVARQLFEARSRKLWQWLDALTQALDKLGATERLANDAAGAPILAALHQLARELRQDSGLYSFAAWRAWLTRELEKRTFRDAEVESPVVFTHLATARLRDVESAIVVGADAAHLPQRRSSAGFFNEAVRAELGLPLFEETMQAMEDDLFDLCTRAKRTWFSWQAQKNDEANLMSPWLERLAALQEAAFDQSLVDTEVLALAGAAPPLLSEIEPNLRPAPSLSGAQLPIRISASGYNTLLECPYRFFASHVLRLRPLDEIDAPVEKREYGNFVHRILQEFHAAVPLVKAISTAAAESTLSRISDEVFAEAIAANPLTLGWLAKWKQQIPAYLDWQREREDAGWQIFASEASKARTLVLDEDTTITLEGRIDRIERDTTGSLAIGDYKTRAYAKLKQSVESPGEDVQLSFYQALFEERVSEVQFICIDNGVKSVIQPDLDVVASEALERLRALWLDLREGAPLPAHGIAETCSFCDMRLLCRKDHWNE